MEPNILRVRIVGKTKATLTNFLTNVSGLDSGMGALREAETGWGTHQRGINLGGCA